MGRSRFPQDEVLEADGDGFHVEDALEPRPDRSD